MLERQINNDEFSAVKYVLDWAGFRVPEQNTTLDTPVTVTVTFDKPFHDEEPLALDA
jgi:hypothetical protein